MKHWTEDDFLRWLYAPDIETGRDDAHLSECESCRTRTEQMIATRREAAARPEISRDFLAAQRRSIYSRLGGESGVRGGRTFGRRWAVAMATLICTVGLSLAALHAWKTETAVVTSSDEKLFADLASIEQSNEPRAIRPIHNLFEE
ncbi:MAG: hypothetical protein M3Z32_02280 [Acidobacteriota bacterium]|nr:hypothetical protein [Acidobacteriota bacterium]